MRRRRTAPAGRPTLALPPAALADDDDEIIPLLGPRRQGFTPEELDALAHPKHKLGGKTVGEELGECFFVFLFSFFCSTPAKRQAPRLL
jgi:hypothetical protein